MTFFDNDYEATEASHIRGHGALSNVDSSEFRQLRGRIHRCFHHENDYIEKQMYK